LVQTGSSSGKVHGISDHLAVILEVEWEDTCTEQQVKYAVPVYNKKSVSDGLEIFLRDKFLLWASNGSNVEKIRKSFKNIVYKNIERFVPHKILRKNSDPEYYNKEHKTLNSKVRKEYIRRKLGVHYRKKLRKLSKQLLAAKKTAPEALLKPMLSKEG